GGGGGAGGGAGGVRGARGGGGGAGVRDAGDGPGVVCALIGGVTWAKYGRQRPAPDGALWLRSARSRDTVARFTARRPPASATGTHQPRRRPHTTGPRNEDAA